MYWKSKFKTFKERFYSHVDVGRKDQCWTWKSFRNPLGYGMFGMKGKATLAHRVSWAIEKDIDVFSIGGTCILHKCDNPSCVNPKHLFSGTRADNAADMAAKGRVVNQHGEDNHKSKLKEYDVVRIRSEYIPYKITYRILAKKYGMSKHQIENVVNRKNWKHVK